MATKPLLPRTHRRRLVAGLVGLALSRGTGQVAAQGRLAFGPPIGWPGRVPADGFFVRVGYACENAAYYPGWWHTGENWHAIAGETAGAEVYAVGPGEVVFAGYDYPGPVVILRHGDALYSQYGHLDYALDVAVGQSVEPGQRLGTVLFRADEPARSHLHLELRTFLTRDDVNGAAPRYGVTCGYQCPPGPGYWPMDAPEHPSDLGYRNPTHALAHLALPGGLAPPDSAVVVPQIVAEGAAPRTAILARPDGDRATDRLTDLTLVPGDRFPLLAVDAGPAASTATSADGYRLWYRIALPEGGAGWVQAALPSDREVASDGRASAVGFAFVPVDSTR